MLSNRDTGSSTDYFLIQMVNRFQLIDIYLNLTFLRRFGKHAHTLNLFLIRFPPASYYQGELIRGVSVRPLFVRSTLRPSSVLLTLN